MKNKEHEILSSYSTSWHRRNLSRAMAIVAMFLSAVVLVGQAIGQQEYEYGKPEDLKGLTRYFVDTGTDVKARTRIVEEIEKARLSNLTLSESSADAQIMLTFSSEIETVPLDNITERLYKGTGVVAVQGRDPRIPRLVLSFGSRQDHKLEKMPYIKFAREFVKAYKKANGVK